MDTSIEEPAGEPQAQSTTYWEKKREDHLANISPFYRGPWWWLHPFATFGGGLAIIIVLLSFVRVWSVRLVPAAASMFIFGMLLEWGIHKFLFHHVRGGFLQKAHLSHHDVYARKMFWAKTFEIYVIMLPWYAVYAVTAFFAPFCTWLGRKLGYDHGLVALAMATFYTIFYEGTHLLYHSPVPNKGLGKLIAVLRRHHEWHHLKNWQRYFGVSTPFVDGWRALLGLKQKKK